MGLGPFKSGLGDAYFNNTCFVMAAQQGRQDQPQDAAGEPEVVGSMAQCDPDHMALHDNYYASPAGRPALKCGGTTILVQDMLQKTGNGNRSTSHKLPSDSEILASLKAHLSL